MSVPVGKLPAQISPLASQGKSLDVRWVDVSGGLLTNIDDHLRPANKAAKLRNFHQLTRGVFSSGGGGWQRDNAAGLNANASGLDFGTYVDALGNQFLMVQVGNTLFNYTLGTGTGNGGGAAIAGMTTLDTSALPCMRAASPTNQTTNPFTIYCNGKQEPVKLYNAAAGSAPNTASTLGFNNGFFTETITLGGTVTVGDTLTLVLTNNPTNAVTPLTLSPHNVSYKTVTGDTLISVATGWANAINNDATCATSAITATAANGVVTISFPTSISGKVSFSYTQGTNTETATLAAGSTSPTFPGVFNGLTYTKPSLCCPFMGRMAYAGFANSGASGNAISQIVLISSLGSAESFIQSTPSRATDAWASPPIPTIMGAVTALASFRPLTNVASELLIVGCQNGMCVISGTDATTFSLQLQSLQFGIPSNRTFVQLDNTLMFMATDGFRIYKGSNNIANLLTDSISLDIYDKFLQVDRTNWSKAHAVHHRDTQEIWFWVPLAGQDGQDGGKPGHAFIYNYNTLDGNPIWYSVDNTTCMASIEFNHTFYGVNDTGLIQKWYGCNNYDDSVSGVAGASNVIPGSELVLSLIGVGNPAQLCSINHVLVGASQNDQKFLINASALEEMDNGSTRKQQQQPYNYLLQSISAPTTVLGTVSGNEWTLNQSAFPSKYPKYLTQFVPIGHGRMWEFSLVCNDSSHNLDFTFLQATISIGGQRI